MIFFISCTLTLLLQWIPKQFQGTSDCDYLAPPNINQSIKLRSISLPDLLYVANLLPLSIHSHIQGPVFAEGEASPRLIHLHGGAAGIQQDSINAAWLNVHVRQQGFKLTESAKQRFHTTAEEKIRESNSAIRYLYINAYCTNAVKSIFKSTVKFNATLTTFPSGG